MDNQLSDTSRNLKLGSIIKIEKFQVLKHSCENTHMKYSVILLVKLKLISFSAQLVELFEAKIGNEIELSSNDSTNQEEAACAKWKWNTKQEKLQWVER